MQVSQISAPPDWIVQPAGLAQITQTRSCVRDRLLQRKPGAVQKACDRDVGEWQVQAHNWTFLQQNAGGQEETSQVLQTKIYDMVYDWLPRNSKRWQVDWTRERCQFEIVPPSCETGSE